MSNPIVKSDKSFDDLIYVANADMRQNYEAINKGHKPLFRLKKDGEKVPVAIDKQWWYIRCNYRESKRF